MIVDSSRETKLPPCGAGPSGVAGRWLRRVCAEFALQIIPVSATTTGSNERRAHLCSERWTETGLLTAETPRDCDRRWATESSGTRLFQALAPSVGGRT